MTLVRGTTSRKIKEMILDAGAAGAFASPQLHGPVFYGVDTPQREKLLAPCPKRCATIWLLIA